jgi:hypothetical protein
MTMSEDEGWKGLNWRRGFLRAPDRGVSIPHLADGHRLG